MNLKLVALALTLVLSMSISPDSTCVFHVSGKLFSLLFLQKSEHYILEDSDTRKVQFDFCQPFLPPECQNQTQTLSTGQTVPLRPSFSFIINKIAPSEEDNTTEQTYTCSRYSSDSSAYYFIPQFFKQEDQRGKLILNLHTESKDGVFDKETKLQITCSQQEYFKLQKWDSSNNELYIKGKSIYGCPVFQLSSLWTVLQQHSIIFGICLFILGFMLLFFGILMLHLTVFITSYFCAFIIFGAIATTFLTLQSSSIAIYFTLLVILLLSTLCAYALTRMTEVSIFLIGAFLGVISGAVVNTLFSDIFGVYSVWSLVFFCVVLVLVFGALSCKYSSQIIILSTSFTGAYMVVRPISWLLGGYPNQFVLYDMYNSSELSSIPWTFYLYLLVIIAIAIHGAMYQIIKEKRKNPNDLIQTNAIQENIEAPIDLVRQKLDNLIQMYHGSNRSSGGQNEYKNLDDVRKKPKQKVQYLD